MKKHLYLSYRFIIFVVGETGASEDTAVNSKGKKNGDSIKSRHFSYGVFSIK